MRKPWLANVLGDNGSGTFAFQTREGGKGILQIIGRSERGVKLRYKLVAFNDDAQISPPGSYRVADLGAKVPADAKPAFGPVMERVLPNGVPCRQLYFQFRSGEIFIVGNGPGTSAAEAAYDEKKIDDAGGVDMSSAGGEEGIQIVGRGCIFTRDAQDLKWDTYTAEQVVEQMKYVSFVEGVVEPRKKDFPITYLFKTARGELGIMEVLGVVNDQRDGWVEKGMKFRYKLVEGGGTKVAPTPPSLVFGPETRGLQAALEVTPGEPFKLRFHIRNVSDTGISIEGAQHRQADDCILEDARGQRVEVVNARRDIKTAMKGGYFIKGQIAVLESAGLSFLPVDKGEIRVAG